MYSAQTGRPLRVRKTPFIMEWEAKQEKIKELADQGKLAVGMDVENPEHVRMFQLGECGSS